MREDRFLFLTFLLVALLGGPTVYSLVREPNFRKRVETKTSEGRLPASQIPEAEVFAEVVPRNAIKAKSVTMELGCQGDSQTQETEGTLLRLKSDCQNESLQKISVLNKTNGFTASVIETKSKGFTTDFIDLQEGDNDLEIAGLDSKGRSVRKILTVKRRIPAAETTKPLPLNAPIEISF